jgi:hypothetical protein
MAVSIAQYVDLLFKKLQGVAKTANATVKGASNESIASPAFLRGDIVWMQSDQIPSTAQAVSNIANARINGNSVECVADNTVPPIGGIYPTWLSNVSYWIPQELGATWLPKVFVGPSGAANIQSTGTQIFAAGIGGAFNAPIAGVLFSLEVLTLDVTISSFITLIIAAASGTLISKIFLGQDVLLSFHSTQAFNYKNLPLYIILGILAGLLSVYHTRIFHWVEQKMQILKFKKRF